MANVKAIVAAHLSKRQRQVNKEVERAEILDEDRLLCKIIRVAGNINVPGKPGFVWCQEYSASDDTNPFHAFNDKVQARETLDVWIGEGMGGRREVLDWNNATIVSTADYAAQKYLPTHHTDHEWPDSMPGPDVVNVYPRALTMLRTYPGEAGALTVSISPLRYIKGNTIVLFPGKISLDISAAQPASGLARFVGIYLDPDDNTIKSVNGATTGDSPAIIPDSPVFPESAILSANVRLDGDQTTFSEIDMSPDIRQILDSSGAIDGTRVSKLVSPDGSVDPVLSVDNNGDIGAGVTPSSVAKFRLSDASGPQLRVEFDATHFADFVVDTNHALTIDPSSTGVIKLAATVTIPDEIQHEGDLTSKMAFAAGQWDLSVTGVNMIRAHNTTQDILRLGDVDGGGDVDVNISDGQVFIKGATGQVSINTINPIPDSLGAHLLNVYTTTNVGLQFGRFSANTGGPILSFVKSRNASISQHTAVLAGDRLGTLVFSGSDGTDFSTPVDMAQIYAEVDAVTGGPVYSGRLKFQTTNTAGARVVAMIITDDQDVGIGVTPTTRFGIGAGAMEFDEMTDPGVGAANTSRTFAEDNAGTTRQRVGFSSGNVVTIAQDGGLQTYTPTNVVTDRSYDANATSVAELADVLGTLIADFQAAGILG